MEYLQPLKVLENKVKTLKAIAFGSSALLLVSIVVTPMVMTSGNAFILKTDDSVVLSKKEPWRATVTRIESFRDAYLKARFEWNETNFSDKKDVLHAFASDNVNAKLKDSLSAFETLIKTQKARSFYILEGFGLSNERHQVEARIVRVLRIGKVAVATPLIIQFEFRDVGLTDANPYGLQISGLTESEVN